MARNTNPPYAHASVQGTTDGKRLAHRLAYLVGARPNLVKTAPVFHELRRRLPDARHVLIHTGQHYDRAMSGVFFDELALPEPDHFLAVGSPHSRPHRRRTQAHTSHSHPRRRLEAGRREPGLGRPRELAPVVMRAHPRGAPAKRVAEPDRTTVLETTLFGLRFRDGVRDLWCHPSRGV